MPAAPERPHPNRYRAAHRLGGERAYQRVFRGGKRFHARGMMIVACPNDLGWMRLGLSVGRRVGRATVRNAVKKAAREAFRRAPSRALGGLDVVVVARDASAFSPLDALDRRIDRLLRDAHRKLVADADRDAAR